MDSMEAVLCLKLELAFASALDRLLLLAMLAWLAGSWHHMGISKTSITSIQVLSGALL